MDVIIGMIIVVSIFIFRFIKSGQQIYRVIVIESNEKYSYEYTEVYRITPFISVPVTTSKN